MMIQRISALSNNANTAKLKQQQYQTTPTFEGLSVNKSAKVMKALAASAILGMAAVNMSACKQPTIPEPIEITEETPVEETPTEETPVEETPDVTPTDNETVSRVEDSSNYKMIKTIGASISVYDTTLEKLQKQNIETEGLKTGNLWGASFSGSTADNLREAIRKIDPKIIRADGGYNFTPDYNKPFIIEGLDKNNKPIWNMSIINKGNNAVLTSGKLVPTDAVYATFDIIKTDGSTAKIEKVKLLSKETTVTLLNLTDVNEKISTEEPQQIEETPVEETPIEETPIITPINNETTNKIEDTNNYKMMKILGANIQITNKVLDGTQQNEEELKTGNFWSATFNGSTLMNILEAAEKVDPKIGYNFSPDYSKPVIIEGFDATDRPMWSISVLNNGNNAVLTSGALTSPDEKYTKIYATFNMTKADGSNAKVEKVRIYPKDVTVSLLNVINNPTYKDLEKIKGTSFYKFLKKTYDKEIYDSENSQSKTTIRDLQTEPYEISLVEVRNNKNIKNGDILEVEITDKNNKKYTIKRNNDGTYSINNEEGIYKIGDYLLIQYPFFSNEDWAKKNKTNEKTKTYMLQPNGTIRITEYFPEYIATEIETKSRKATIAYVPEN